jgi:hypothetical protein
LMAVTNEPTIPLNSNRRSRHEEQSLKQLRSSVETILNFNKD